jgi:hypothetical protein
VVSPERVPSSEYREKRPLRAQRKASNREVAKDKKEKSHCRGTEDCELPAAVD